jgi:deoxyribonuclease IV
MIRVGSHLSIAGGFRVAARSAIDLELEAMQIFSRSPRGGEARVLSSSDVAEFKSLCAEGGISPVVIHVPYYLNLASLDPQVVEYTRTIISLDLARAAALGARYVVSHMGHAVSEDPQGDIARALDGIFEQAPDQGPLLLLENTAGQGREVGTTPSYVMETISRTKHPERLGFCLDTCHAFASGYDLSREDGLQQLIDEISGSLGLDRLRVIHANDSKTPLGSRKDRHESIGEGAIGRHGFGLIMNAPEFDGKVAILETPLTSREVELKNVRILKELRR